MRRAMLFIVFGAVVMLMTTLVSCSTTAEMSEPSMTPEPQVNDEFDTQPRDKRSGSGDIPALTLSLNQLFVTWQSDPEAAIEQAMADGLQIEGDRVKIMLIMLNEDTAEDAVDVISELGGEVTDRYQTWVDAWVSIETLDVVTNLSGLSQVREPIDIVHLGPQGHVKDRFDLILNNANANIASDHFNLFPEGSFHNLG